MLTTVSRPTLLAMPYPLLAWIFVLSQNPSMPAVCRTTRILGQDPYVRAQYLAYRNRFECGSFFVALLRNVPPVENPILWKVLKNRHVRSLLFFLTVRCWTSRWARTFIVK